MRKFLILFLLTSSSLLSQSDFWTHHSLNTPVYQLVNYADSILMAVRDIDIIKSTDRGLNWDTIYTTPYPCSVWTKLDLFQRRITNGQIYMIIQQRNGSSGCTNVPVCISTNSGQNWQSLNLPNGNFGDIDITSNGTLVLVSDTAYYSTNIGSSWNYLNIPNDGTLKQKIEVDADDNLYVVREHKYWYEPAWIWFRSESLYKSTDFGQSWEFLFNTIYEPNANFMTLFHTENSEIIASQSVPAPKTWYYKENSINVFPLWGITSSVVINSKFFFVSPQCCNNQGVNYSSDFGQTWVSQNAGLTDLGCSSIIKDTLGYLYVGTGNGIFKSKLSQLPLFVNPVCEFEDTRISDTTYKQITLVNPFNFNLNIDSLKFQSENFFSVGVIDSVLVPGNNNSISLGFSPSQFGELTSRLIIYNDFIIDEIELSGTSPVPTLFNFPYNNNFGDVQVGDTARTTIKLSSESLNKIEIDSIYMQVNQLFFIDSIDFPINIDFQDTVSFNVFFVPITQSVLPKQDHIIIRSNSLNDPLSLVIKGRGVNPNAVENEDKINNYVLSECYPNPFNPNTTIEYQVPKTSKIKISVYNLVGEEIAIIVNEEQTQGKYKVEFNGVNLSSGVYFYKMQTEEYTSTKKFILLK